MSRQFLRCFGVSSSLAHAELEMFSSDDFANAERDSVSTSLESAQRLIRVHETHEESITGIFNALFAAGVHFGTQDEGSQEAPAGAATGAQQV